MVHIHYSAIASPSQGKARKDGVRTAPEIYTYVGISVIQTRTIIL